ncbi:protein NRT1/ PTR FAMILY 1.2 isoform X2 [Sesamum indicum]|uniref:Protein NRT1/ PTR FAMILY 1.2 isoform X2 n=1 Tax=Sesamum indicum TaxID=4182 RepID=A0A6I9TVC5_SESIN|nr:protein NRT1/ PTR FAMILY 1.2 isoform X2 [Sesamum indicum]
MEEKNTMLEEHLLERTDQKGGFRTLPFIIGIEALEKMATFGLMPNMTLYLMKEYHMGMTTASNLLFFWSAATNFMPLLGALVADSFLGRFYTIGIGSVISLMGMILLWSTTVIPQARPPPCKQFNNSCSSPTTFQFMYLCTAFGLISVGAGGIRSSSLAFGADQLEKGDFKKSSDNMGWGVGFAVPAVLMLIGVSIFFLASRFYVKLKSKTSLVTGFIQVVTASYRNRRLDLTDGVINVCHRKAGSALVFPSENLRFLNKACIVRDPDKDLTAEGRAVNPWSLCSVEQVEELKALLRVLPIWSTGMIMSINISQNSFPLLQAVSMDRRITSSFTIPAASFSTFTVISVILWVAVYDRVFLPLASRVMRRPVHVSTKRRMGIGIVFSFLAMLASAGIEAIRRSLAIDEGYLDHPLAMTQMSAMWLVPQNCLTGFAEASNAIAQNEFYFSEFPRSMSSIASTLNGIGMSLANLAASLIMNAVDSLSKAGGQESWISSNINKGHYDYYYLVLAALSMANMMYFLVCSSMYGPLKEEGKIAEEEDEP